MKHVLFIFLVFFASSYFCCKTDNTGLNNQDVRILKVPAEFATILDAVENSEDGDWIILAPGKYYENGIIIDKAVTVSSEWKLTGDESIIDQTIIDAQDTILFTVTSSGAEISGLNIINGDHTLNISSNVTVSHNHFKYNLDAMSFESGSGGYVGYNTVENDRDDGLDFDIGSEQDNIGSDILVERNTIINSHDDGIEIRLFSHPNQNINYEIRQNTIIGSNNAGIQLISYDEYTGKVFYIHHNIIRGCKTALGCMEGSNTAEDMSGASKMDERVYLYNNTLIENKMGATGGNNIIALNNIVSGNESGGFKRFGTGSAIINNLFYQNGVDDFIEVNSTVTKEGNLFTEDPLIDKTSSVPVLNSPCINAGLAKYELNGLVILEVASEYFTGEFPDIGAMEFGMDNKTGIMEDRLIVYAGEDLVLKQNDEPILRGQIRVKSIGSIDTRWEMETEYGRADIVNPGKLETEVVIHQQGIYQFTLSCTDKGNGTSSTDNVIIRLINDGNGKKLFFSDKLTNIIEAEDYAYSYGDITVLDDSQKPDSKSVMIKGDSDYGTSILEFSIGTSENSEYVIWLLVKCQAPGICSLLVSLNKLSLVLPAINNNGEWKWIKAEGIPKLTAGQWPLLISNERGSVLIDKILFSTDPGFFPDK